MVPFSEFDGLQGTGTTAFSHCANERDIGSTAMKVSRAVRAHEIPQRSPLQVSAGDHVTIETLADDEWPAFAFISCAGGSGWVPSRYLSAAAIGSAVVRVPYDTTELPTQQGERVLVITDDGESGWSWCRADDGREGWVPNKTLGD
jgi:hypothetical protein